MANPKILFFAFFFCLCFSSTMNRIGASEVAWTMVFLPDTQKYKTPETEPIFQVQTQWIVENKSTRNIEIVLHGGDVTDDNIPSQWQVAKQAFSTLDGVVPYTIAFGNHDMWPIPPFDRSQTLLNDYFSLSDNPLNAITTERIPGDLSNTYSKFTAPDGRKILVFALEFLPRSSVTSWAGSIATLNPDYTAVVLTHANLAEKIGETNDGEPISERSSVGNQLWDRVTGQHANIEMVLNAHQRDQDDTDPYGPLLTARLESTGVHGNTVHEIAFNSQFQDNGGNGFLRLFEFLDNGQTVQVRTYSPTLDVWLTNDRNEFQIELTPLFSANFDADADVDGVDFLAWQRGSGITTGAQFDQGDANMNGAVDETDLGVWLQQFGTIGLLPAAKSIPEPQSAALLVLALLQSICRRKGI